MKQLGRVGIVGCGPSGVYLLKHILDRQNEAAFQVSELHTFEREPSLGHCTPDRLLYDHQDLRAPA